MNWVLSFILKSNVMPHLQTYGPAAQLAEGDEETTRASCFWKHRSPPWSWGCLWSMCSTPAGWCTGSCTPNPATTPKVPTASHPSWLGTPNCRSVVSKDGWSHRSCMSLVSLFDADAWHVRLCSLAEHLHHTAVERRRRPYSDPQRGELWCQQQVWKVGCLGGG